MKDQLTAWYKFNLHRIVLLITFIDIIDQSFKMENQDLYLTSALKCRSCIPKLHNQLFECMVEKQFNTIETMQYFYEIIFNHTSNCNDQHQKLKSNFQPITHAYYPYCLDWRSLLCQLNESTTQLNRSVVITLNKPYMKHIFLNLTSHKSRNFLPAILIKRFIIQIRHWLITTLVVFINALFVEG